MSSGSNSGNAASAKLQGLQARQKEQEMEAREGNIRVIMNCFLGMVLISVFYVVGVIDLLAFLFAASEWHGYAKLTLYLVFGMGFLGMGGFGWWTAKQHK